MILNKRDNKYGITKCNKKVKGKCVSIGSCNSCALRLNILFVFTNNPFRIKKIPFLFFAGEKNVDL